MLLPYMETGRIEAGCDEAGRGCLAGAVFAAAVILPEDFKNEDLNDSKQLSEKKRYKLRPVIEREAIAWAVGIVSPEEIDKINILKASFLADASCDRAIESTAGTFIDRWKPFYPLSRYSTYDRSKRRWQIPEYRRRLYIG